MNALLAFLRAFFAGMLDAWRAGGGDAAVPAAGSAPAPPAPAVPEAPAGAGPRRINAAGLALVELSEGERNTAYPDSGGVWTIGFGHTRGVVKPGMTETEQQAVQDLLADLEDAEREVEAATQGISLTDNQFSALVDFAFNEGAEPLHQLLAHGIDQVPVQILRWQFSKDRSGIEIKSQGLLVRRERERGLWLSA